MIKPILSPQNKQNKKWNKNLFEKQGKKSSLYDSVTRYYVDALKNMLMIVNESVNLIINKKKENDRITYFQNVCKDVPNECDNRLENF